MPPDSAEIRARAFWSGTISFGLVSIPVNLFPANRSGGVALRMLDEDGTPLRRRFYCPAEDREVEREEIVRGFEMEDGSYVVVTDEELEALEPKKTRDIDLTRFVKESELDPMYFERGYYLTPAGDSTKAYRLLAQTMERTGRAGIATFIMRGKEYLVAILAERGILRAETLRFRDELRPPDELRLPEPAKPPAALVRRITRAIETHSAATLDPDELRDRYTEKVRKLVERKRRKREDVVEMPEAEAEAAAAPPEVIDLMEVLKRSMRVPEAGARRPARRARGAAPTGDLKELSVQELQQRARALGIAGRTKMNKAQLIGAIRRAA